MKSTRTRLLAAAVAVGVLTAAGCSETTDDASTTTAGAQSTTEDSKADDSKADDSMADDSKADDSMADDSMADGSMADDSMADHSMADGSMADDSMAEGGDADAELQWALDYTGGTAGAADGDPIKIGWASASDTFPHADTAAMTAADYINNELGGIGGRPLELVPCNLATPEDGAKCGGQFANDDTITVALTGATTQGAADFFTAIGDSKATMTASPLSLDDFVSKQSVAYTTGALGAGMGLAMYTVELKPTTVAGVVTDDPAGQAGLSVFTPIMEAAGINFVPVLIPPTATAPEVESALTAAGAVDADVIIIGTFEQACIAAYDALSNLGISGVDRQILGTTNCMGDAMQAHVAEVGDGGDFPNGWNFVNFGANPFDPNIESGMQTYLSVMEAAGNGDVATKDAAIPSFVTIMSLAKFLNEADGDYSAATVNGLIRDFKGPAMIQAGPIDCALSQTFSGICASRVGFSRYLDGEWSPVHEGDDSVDITPPLTAGNK